MCSLPPYMDKQEEMKYTCGKAWTENALPDFRHEEQQPCRQSMAHSQAIGKGGRCQSKFPSGVQVHGAGVASEGDLPRLSDMDLMAGIPGGPSASFAGRCGGKGNPAWVALRPHHQPPRMGDSARSMAWNAPPPTREQFRDQVRTEDELPSWSEGKLWEQEAQRGYPSAGRTGRLTSKAGRPTAGSVSTPVSGVRESMKAVTSHPAAVVTAPDLPFYDEQPDRLFPHHGVQHPIRVPPPPPAHAADLTLALARKGTSSSLEKVSRPTAQVWDAKVQQLRAQQGISQRKYEWKAYTEGALPRMDEDSLWEPDSPRRHCDSRDSTCGLPTSSSQMPWNNIRTSHFGEETFHSAQVNTAPELPNMNIITGALAEQKDLGWHGKASDSNAILGKVPTDGDLPSFRRASGSKVSTEGDLPVYQGVLTEGDLPTMQRGFGKAEKRVTFEPRFGRGGSSSFQHLQPPPGLEMPPGLGARTGCASASPSGIAAVAAAAAAAGVVPGQTWEERL